MKRPFNWALVGGVIVIAAIALSFLGDTDEGEQAAAPTAVVQVPAPSAQTAPAPETAAAEPAKPAPDMVRTKPQGDAVMAKRAEPGAPVQTPAGGTDESEQAAPAGAPAPAPSARTAPGTAPGTTQGTTQGTAQGTAPPSGTAAARPVRPSFDIVRINPQCDTVMAGRAEPGARVQILDGGKVIGEATADARGEWVFVPAEPLPPGNRQLSLRTVGTGGRPAVTSDSNVVLAVPEKGKDIAGRPSEEPSQPLALKVPSEGGATTQVLQKPTPTPKPTPPAPAPAPALLAVTIDAVDYDDRGRLNVIGTGAPDGQVHLYLNNEFLGRSPTGADGRWRQSPERTVAPGVYSVRADQVDDAGKVLARIEVVFARSTLLTDVPPGTLFVVQPGNSLWRIARRTYGRGIRFTVIYEANRNQIRDEDLIYPGQVFRLPSIN